MRQDRFTPSLKNLTIRDVILSSNHISNNYNMNMNNRTKQPG